MVTPNSFLKAGNILLKVDIVIPKYINRSKKSVENLTDIKSEMNKDILWKSLLERDTEWFAGEITKLLQKIMFL